MACGEGIVVAVGGQVATMKILEVMLLRIDLLKDLVAAHTLIADLAILYGVVVANHINIK